MRGIVLRGLAERRARALGMVLAVFLGVSLVAGSLVFTDTINRSFDDIFEQSLEGSDLIVTPREIVRRDNEEPPAFDASLLGRVRAVGGVEAAAGAVGKTVRLVDAGNEQLGNGFAPNFVFSTVPERFDPVTYVEGRPPRTGDEAAVDEATAQRAGLEIGDTVGVAGDRAVSRYRIVGLNKLGDASIGGSASATLTLPEARAVTGREGRFDQILVAAGSGIAPDALRDRVARVLPEAVRVETAGQNADRETAEIGDDFLGVMRTILLVFGGIVTVVAAFLIFNTFSITVAQRIRELGLLRTLGASRRQILAAVIGESAAIGALGALTGLAGGVGAAILLRALFKALQIDLPSSGTVLEPRTVVVALLVGLVVTLVASLVPALRATRVTPMAALLEAELPERRGRGRGPAIAAAVLGAAGLALLSVGLFGGAGSAGTAAGMMGGGAAAILFAVSLYSPRLIGPLASLLGRPIEALRGMPGRLARENVVRKPGRTAATAAALMIGLALVTFVTVFAAGISTSLARSIEKGIEADLIVQSSDGFSPIPAAVSSEVASIEGVGSVSALARTSGRVVGDRGRSISGIEPASLLEQIELTFDAGSAEDLRDLGPDQAVISRGYADDRGIELGETLRTVGGTGARARFEVVAIFEGEADVLGAVVVTRPALERAFGESRIVGVYAKVAQGMRRGAVETRIERLLEERYPAAEVLDQQSLQDAQEAQVMPILGLFYGLLSLAVIVSLFGIANTLSLSIHERTRELGMLRAIGMDRRQVRRVVRYESVITALIGAVLGMVLGVAFAALVSRPLAEDGFVLSYPILTLAFLLVLAALAGVLAAILPARRAARLDVLEALAYE